MTDEAYTLPPAAAPANHGHTRASWTLVAGVVLGTLLIGIGLAIGEVTIQVTGIAVALGSVLASYALRARGFGQPTSGQARRDWYADSAA